MNDLWLGIIASVIITIFTLIFAWYTEKSKRLLIVYKQTAFENTHRVLVSNVGKEAILPSDLALKFRLPLSNRIIMINSSNRLNKISISRRNTIKFKYLNPRDTFIVEYEGSFAEKLESNEIINGNIYTMNFSGHPLLRIPTFMISLLSLVFNLIYMPVMGLVVTALFLYAFLNEESFWVKISQTEYTNPYTAGFTVFMLTLFPILWGATYYNYWKEYSENKLFLLRVPKDLVKAFNED